MGLGLDESERFGEIIKEMEIELNNNDIVALYSDGVPESQNSKMDEFGYERFESIMIENSEANSEEISNKIMQELTVFSQHNAQHDDITLLIFKWKFNNKTVGEA